MINPVLRIGDTCWRTENADRFAMIVDAADYFTVLRQAMQQAQHNIMMIGWEFDTRTDLDPRSNQNDIPRKLGRFLNWLVGQRPNLKIHLLEWDIGLLSTLVRGSTPLRLADWFVGRKICLKLDHAHPIGAAHHQKIIVIDDALAFCGGIDATADRWDTSEHEDDSPLRISPTLKRLYGPWHDAAIAVSGNAAKALGDLARARWENATGDRLPAAPPVSPIWPEFLEPLLTNVEVAISRTEAAYAGRDSIREIEALHLAIIAATRRTLYIESQYFASRTMAEAIAARLGEPEGPEFVVINPESSQGWLEEKAMGSARSRLLKIVNEADVHDRFRIFTPVTQAQKPIYVHAKIVVMDDTLMRVGSSNLNNRSMGHDTECDLSIEANHATPNEKQLRKTIAGLRNSLVAEHLGVNPGLVEQAAKEAGGSLISAIEALRRSGRSLVPFVAPDFGLLADSVLRENELLDPERAAGRWPWSR